ncbi:hypothetical protein FA13DRAFT_1085616 [Coprinellus micaceus]|uniref:Uncharacterized protein n=1 Tax=Coprinellus micaceus TaxID=71717 RepID=A0A4Y7TSB0_COPMI|nr:hypothetical protein FA13DRAFT_1085616 [Coprinellus micaceus]
MAILAAALSSTDVQGPCHWVSLLLEGWSDPVLSGRNEGGSCLHSACRLGREDIALLLLQHGVDPNIKDRSGNTALRTACHNDQAACAKILLDHGAKASEGDVPVLQAWSVRLYSRSGAVGRGALELGVAICLLRELLRHRPPGHLEHAIFLGYLALYLNLRSGRSGSIPDIDEAVRLTRGILRHRPPGHTERTKSLWNLAAYLHWRSVLTCSTPDMNEAICFLRELLEYPAPEGSERAVYLLQLALSLYWRSVRSGSISDINEAIRLTTEVLEHRPLGHPDRAEALQGLATAVNCRAQISGSLAVVDVDKAVHLCRDALGLRPPGDAKRGSILHSLCLCLIFRFEARQNVHDLNEATSLCREALPLHPPGSDYHIRTLRTLATVLQLQPEHLDEALELSRKSVSLICSAHSDRWEHLMTLASILHRRYKRSGAVMDLEEAITICAKAMALCPPKHIRRHKLLALQANLAEY